MRRLLILCLAAGLAPAAVLADDLVAPFALAGGDRVVFVGSGLIGRH